MFCDRDWVEHDGQDGYPPVERVSNPPDSYTHLLLILFEDEVCLCSESCPLQCSALVQWIAPLCVYVPARCFRIIPASKFAQLPHLSPVFFAI